MSKFLDKFRAPHFIDVYFIYLKKIRPMWNTLYKKFHVYWIIYIFHIQFWHKNNFNLDLTKVCNTHLVRSISWRKLSAILEGNSLWFPMKDDCLIGISISIQVRHEHHVTRSFTNLAGLKLVTNPNRRE